MKQTNRNLIAAVAGNIVEHYDTSLFAFIAPYLAPLFFPTLTSINALILTYAMLPLELIARPIGALIFGYIGDRHGRVKALSLSITATAITTALIGCLPTYQSVGIAAPLLLASLRLIQKLSAAGECIGGAVLILENGNPKRRGILGSIYDASSIIGVMIASLMVSIFAQLSLLPTYWRYLFWLGALGNLCGAIIRRYASDPPTLDLGNECETIKQRLRDIWGEVIAHRVPFFVIIVISGFTYTTYSVAFIFLNSFIPLVSANSSADVLSLNTILLLGDILLLPFFGWLADRGNKALQMIAACAVAVVSATPLLLCCQGASLLQICMIRFCWVAIGIAFSAPFHSFTQQLVPTRCRYTIVSLGYAIGSQLIGAPFSSLGLLLFSYTKSPVAPALYIMAVALLTASVIARYCQSDTYAADKKHLTLNLQGG